MLTKPPAIQNLPTNLHLHLTFLCTPLTRLNVWDNCRQTQTKESFAKVNNKNSLFLPSRAIPTVLMSAVDT
eukprot:4128039-Pyramimonas_sp.AAC.1